MSIINEVDVRDLELRATAHLIARVDALTKTVNARIVVALPEPEAKALMARIRSAMCAYLHGHLVAIDLRDVPTDLGQYVHTELAKALRECEQNAARRISAFLAEASESTSATTIRSRAPTRAASAGEWAVNLQRLITEFAEGTRPALELDRLPSTRPPARFNPNTARFVEDAGNRAARRGSKPAPWGKRNRKNPQHGFGQG